MECAPNEVEKANFLEKENERKKIAAKKKRDQRQARKLREANPTTVARMNSISHSHHPLEKQRWHQLKSLTAKRRQQQ